MMLFEDLSTLNLLVPRAATATPIGARRQLANHEAMA